MKLGLFKAAFRKKGPLLLGIWLIAVGLLSLLSITDRTLHAATAMLAVAAGVLLLLDK